MNLQLIESRSQIPRNKILVRVRNGISNLQRQIKVRNLILRLDLSSESVKELRGMKINASPDIYLRATREESSLGVINGIRPEPTLSEAREELSEAISRVVTSLAKENYDPLLGAVSQPAVNEFLKGFESNLSRAKGDLSLVLEELFDRIISKNLRKGN